MDFFALFAIIQKENPIAFLLESLGEETYDSRYSAIGFAPQHELYAIQDKFFIDGKEIACENPYYFIRENFPKQVISRHYAGGLVGYLGYDSANYFEKNLNISYHPHFPAFYFGYYTDGLVYDKFTGEIYYFYYNTERQSTIERYLEELRKTSYREEKVEVSFKGFSKSQKEHEEMVYAVLEEIKAGNTFQCQIGLSLFYELRGDPLMLYARLREINPSPYMFYLKFRDLILAGASPELVFRLRQGEMETYPLAGTTHRGSNAEEDRRLVRSLLTDPKEIAEHNMLIDLHRNDIGRVARFGTVKVRRFFDIKKFSHVQHISSEVVGIISPKHDMFTALASVFPAGTLSGAPKIESMKIIDRIEKEPRGPYGGAVGHFGFNGDCTFAIPIRSFFVKGNKIFARASGGIVYDSRPEKEYREIMGKLAAIQKAFSLYEVKNAGTHY
ncbi:MAG: chorismate-binding protein [Leptospiraceae bacterium]|nr:chorismate-binding protein [Leptospiraceae bacterium]MDW8305681.1 chorismate-binding protein [Leptospiraceae bacterium]